MRTVDMRLLSALFLVAIAFVLPSPSAAAGVFKPDTFTLDNGMQVVVVTNRRAPVVTHMVWYKVGAADEPLGQSGIAHFLEHLMFKGTETAPPGTFSQTVARLGGRENAFTGHDYTGYFQTIAREHLETVMALEADRMTNLVLAEEQIETERDVVLEERRQRIDNEPRAILGEMVDAALFLNHPYGRPIIGWRHEIESLQRSEILDFYRRHYAPDNAILVVAGDIDAEAVRSLAETYYGPIAAADVAPRLQVREPPHAAPRHVALADARVRQPIWQRAYLAPSYGAGDQATADALQVAASVLGAGPTSLLYRRLVVDRELAVSAGAGFSPQVRGPATLTVYAVPRPGVSLDDLQAAVDAVLADAIANGLPAADVDRVKARIVADADYARDSLSAAAHSLGAALAAGRTVDDVETWPERIAAVTLDQANAALAAALNVDQSVTARLLPTDPEQAAAR
jgi:zinc protease